MTLSREVNLNARPGVKRVPKDDTSLALASYTLDFHPSSNRSEGTTSMFRATTSVAIMGINADTKARKYIAPATGCRSPEGGIYGTTIVSPDLRR
jgi:hypothetical protein